MLKHEDIWYVTCHTLVTLTTCSIVYTLQALSRGSVAVTNSIRINILIAFTRKAHPNWSKPSCRISKVTITAQVTARSWHTTNTTLQYKAKCLTTVSIHLAYSTVLHNQVPLTQSLLSSTHSGLPAGMQCQAIWFTRTNTLEDYQTHFSHSAQFHITENSIVEIYMSVLFHITH